MRFLSSHWYFGKDSSVFIIREDCNPELLAKEYYSFPIYLLLEICAKYDDIPESTLENFFKESEEHANFLIDCVKVKWWLRIILI